MRPLLAGIALLFTLNAAAQDCATDIIRTDGYPARRSQLAVMIDTSSLLVMKAGEENDMEILKFRQDRDFQYLTGILAPGARMILAPRGIVSGSARKTCFFFLNMRWNPDAQVPLTGSDTLLDITRFDTILAILLPGVKTLYYHPQSPFVHDWINGKPYFADKEMRKAFEKAHPGAKMKPAGTLIAKLRQIKTEDELAALSKAIAMTGDGIDAALRGCKPGMYEYEVQALIEYEATRQGANGMGFPSIVGGGKNSLIPHYFDNNCKLQKGDLLVMDVGAVYWGYSADVTRTIPVSGKFTAEQAEVYNVVLDVQKALIKMVRPGITYAEIDKTADQLIRKAGYGKYILHGVTHTIGLNVHDVMSGDTLRPGMVITIEPGIYIPGEDTIQPRGRKGFGIRIEDDVLIIKDGYEVLSSGIPKEIADIEKRMRED
jgi:Xaa-Pro aminopeptidase